MKTLRKSVLFILMTVITFSFMIISASASNPGDSTDNPVVMKNGVKYYKEWEDDGQEHLNYSVYNKVTLTSSFCVEFDVTIHSGTSSSGAKFHDEITVYNQSGEKIIGTEFSSGKTVLLPLGKGVYYIKISRDAVDGYMKSLDMSYFCYLSSGKQWEQESNGTLPEADPIPNFKIYKAVFSGENDTDIFSVNLYKGKDCTLNLYYVSQNALKENKVTVSVLDSEGKEIKVVRGKTVYPTGAALYTVFTFAVPDTGRYYIKICGSYAAHKGVYSIDTSFDRIDASSYSVKIPDCTYTGNTVTPCVTVTDGAGKTLVQDVDYKITYYTRRKNVGTHEIKITYLECYEGSITVKFIINPPAPVISSLTADASSFTVSWKEESDRVFSYELCYATDSSFKSAKVVTGRTNGVSKTVKSLSDGKKYYVRMRTYKSSDGRYYYSAWSAVKTVTTKIKASSYPVKLSKTAYTYNGKNATPSVTITDPSGKIKLVKNKDYKLTVPSARKNIGTYNIKIEYIGNYYGSKTVSFKINPPKPALSSVTAGEGAFTAKWKQTKQTTGYQIQYSTSSSFKSAKTVKITKYKTVSKKISSLKEAKKYYVRIRSYKTVKDTNYYSSWSSAKSVTTKRVIGVNISDWRVTACVGDKIKLRYTVYPTNVLVKWKSDNPSVARVDSYGNVTALKTGNAQITAYFVYNNKTYKSTVDVSVSVPKIELDETSKSIYKGDSFTLYEYYYPSKLNVKVLWKTSNANVAKVNSKGVVTGVSAGTAYITAYFVYNGITYSSQPCAVTVVNRNPVSFLDVYWEKASNGGIKPRMKIRNNTNKYIKYINMDVYFYNRFGDPAYCRYQNVYNKRLHVESGLGAKSTKTFYWDSVLFNDHVSRIDIGEVSVTYIDNTVEVFYLYNYWYDSNYYYQ